MRKLIVVSIIVMSTLGACEKNVDPVTATSIDSAMYFPALTGEEWRANSPASLGWDEANLNATLGFLETKGTKAFIILKNGRVVVEKYFGTFNKDSLWYWASAGKTMTGFLVGVAQKNGLLNIQDKTSQYLGTGWTSLPIAKENLITIKNQLSMTTGLNDATGDLDCTLPACLAYRADAGTRWAYHNAPYTLLDKVIENASGLNYNSFFQQYVRNRIGMNGFWIKTPNSNNVLYSTPRSMARFGLLLLNKGAWDGQMILDDSTYFHSQTNTSQNLNLSYGYLTWLNGKSSYMLPTTQTIFTGAMVPNAPLDMYAALGKNDQKIYVVPSQKIVVIRMGNDAGNSYLALSSFDNELWGYLKNLIK